MEEFQWGKCHPMNSLLQFGIWDIVLAEVQLLPVGKDILLDRIRQTVVITGKWALELIMYQTEPDTGDQ